MLSQSGQEETVYLDAVVLLAEAASITKERLYASFSDPLPEQIFRRFEGFLRQRLSGVPVSYIRNKKEFYSREFYVDHRVLVPRPDTEIIVEETIRLGKMFEPPVSILDLCTGSGCIAVTLAAEAEYPAHITGADISGEAGEVFLRNSRDLLGRELPFIQTDLFDAIPGSFDIICSNPPYLTDAEIKKFREIGWPEPETALAGGEDGLYIVRKIVKKSVEHLKQNGYLLIEASPEQMEQISAQLQKGGFADIRRIKDFGQRERVISARWVYG